MRSWLCLFRYNKMFSDGSSTLTFDSTWVATRFASPFTSRLSLRSLFISRGDGDADATAVAVDAIAAEFVVTFDTITDFVPFSFFTDINFVCTLLDLSAVRFWMACDFFVIFTTDDDNDDVDVDGFDGDPMECGDFVFISDRSFSRCFFVSFIFLSFKSIFIDKNSHWKQTIQQQRFNLFRERIRFKAFFWWKFNFLFFILFWRKKLKPHNWNVYGVG